MKDINTSPRKVFVPIILYLTTAIIAFVLMVVAFVIWIAKELGSGSLAVLIVGAVFLVLAAIIYLVSARKSIDYIRDRLDTIYDVAYSLRRGYRATVNILNSFLDDVFTR